MVFAQISDGIVVNTIVLDDDSLLHLFQAGFDACLRIDNINPQPQIGWLWNGSNFLPGE